MSNPTVIILGDVHSGKTALFKKMVNSEDLFNPAYEATIGVDGAVLKTRDKKLQLWDTSGDPRFRFVINAYLKNAHIAVYCLDLSKSLNKEKVAKDIESFRHQLGANSFNIPIILVGTKTDLISKVSDNEFIQLAHDFDLGFKQSVKVSAASNRGISAFLKILSRLVAKSELTSRGSLNMNAMDEALRLLPKSSQLYKKINLLNLRLVGVSKQTQQLIGSATLALVNAIQSDKDALSKGCAIEDFENQCINYLGGTKPFIQSAILGVAVTALVVVLFALVGFGIGFAAGVWTGPGAFITGVSAGSAAASAVVTTSSLYGLGLGIFSGVIKHNTLMNQNVLVQDILDCVRENEFTSPSL